MSLDTWKAEFYPIPASEVPVEDALDHSIKKWSGLTQENMEKHGVSKLGDSLLIGSDLNHNLYIDSLSCSLCSHHIRSKCSTCPITLYTGDQEAKCNKQYRAFIQSGDPIPMIDLLNSVKAAQCGNQTSPTSTDTDVLVEQPEC